MWIARKDSFKVEIQKAGTKLNYSPNAFWWVSLPKNKWDDDPEEIKVESNPYRKENREIA
jgi:hypothetical protein